MNSFDHFSNSQNGQNRHIDHSSESGPYNAIDPYVKPFFSLLNSVSRD